MDTYQDLDIDPMKWAKGDILICLGGMAALDHKFGIVDKGAGKDLDSAFSSVRSLIENSCICGFQLYNHGYDDSQELKRRQEEATALEVECYYRKAKEILADNNEFFEKIASELAKKGLLTMKDIQEIKKSCRIQPAAI